MATKDLLICVSKGVLGMHATPNFFHFHAVFGKTSCQIIDYCPPPLGLAPPHLGNSRSTTGPPLNWILSFPMFGLIWLRAFNLILCKIILRVSRGNHFAYRVETSHQCDYSLRDIHKLFLIHQKHNSAFTLTKIKTDTMVRNVGSNAHMHSHLRHDGDFTQTFCQMIHWNLGKQECIPVGCVPPVDRIPACTAQGGGGVSQHALGRGVSAQGVCIPACNGADTPRGQTDTCENITFANFVCGR